MSATPLLVFARCAGFAFRAPGFSHPSVPRAVRAGIALALAAAIAPSVHASSVDGIGILVAALVEFAIGTAIGMAAALLYDGAYAGGRMIDDYVGVKAIAPSMDLVAPSGFGRLWSLTFTAGYVLLGAYRPVVLAFAQSFAQIAPGAPVGAQAWLSFAQSLAGTIVGVAASVAAPAIALAFVMQIALAALSRTIPRFATFALSFPLVFGAVVAASAIVIPLLAFRAGHPIVMLPQ